MTMPTPDEVRAEVAAERLRPPDALSVTPPNADGLLIATSPRIAHESGWSASLALDERLPVERLLYIDTDPNRWAVDAGCFASLVTRERSDDALRYEQVCWFVDRFAARGYLARGDADSSGTWLIKFPDGSTDYGYVLSANVLDFRDIAAIAKRVKYEHKFQEPKFPYGEGGRWAGRSAYDEHGRERTTIWEG